MHAQIDADVPAAALFAIDRGGDVVVQDAAAADVLDERGTLPSGALCVLADHALGAGVAEMLGPDERMVTSHLHVELIRPLVPGLTHVVGTCAIVERVPGSAFAPGVVRDPDGGLLARISARFAILDGAQVHGGAVIPTAATAAGDGEPDHPLLLAPVYRTLGARMVEVADGRVRLTVRAAPALANERGGVHGGVGALAGERAGDLAVRSAADRSYRPVELRVVFVRPVAADGSDLAVDAEVTFLGRTTALTTARLRRGDGKLAVQVDAVHTTTPPD